MNPRHLVLLVSWTCLYHEGSSIRLHVYINVYNRLYPFIHSGQTLPGRSYTDSLIAAYAMAPDSSKWDVKMLLRMVTDRRFDPNEITFPNADALLLEITSVIQQVF